MAKRMIRALTMACVVALMAACTTAMGGGAGTTMVDDGQAFSMTPGQQVMLADHSQLLYVRLVADSRCRPDVQCIRAGDAEIAMRWLPNGGDPEDFSLKIPPPAQPQSHALGTRTVTLESLDRGAAPTAGLRIDAGN